MTSPMRWISLHVNVPGSPGTTSEPERSFPRTGEEIAGSFWSPGTRGTRGTRAHTHHRLLQCYLWDN